MRKDIAIIGMAGRFPDANDLGVLFDNLKAGKDSVRGISGERLRSTTLPLNREYQVCGYLEDIHCFDHKLFNIPLGEAQNMDPHQRLLLEVVYETLENSSYSVDFFNGSNTCVYVADADLEYYKHADDFNPTLITGNTKAFLASRIGRQFNLKGSVAMIDTTCSSSVMALYLACNELILGDAEYGLACGVNLILFPYKEATPGLGLDSPDGKSRAFSAAANGMSMGEAVAGVLLKPLDKAIADGDIIHAVIKGIAVNNNADQSASLTAPDSIAQAEVIKKAWRKAGIDPRDIGFIETHGSGTQLGDHIEVGGLDLAFIAFTEDKNWCPISTIKSNIGHSRVAAGMAGLLKAVLSLKHRLIFPTIHFDEPSPLIHFDRSAVVVNEKLIPWEAPEGKPRYAGVSSIGLSGTNCHVVLEESPRDNWSSRTDHVKTPSPYVFPVSSGWSGGLRENLSKLLGKLRQDGSPDIAGLSYTLATGRKHYPFRLAFVATGIGELTDMLEKTIGRGDIPASPPPQQPRQLICVFSDQETVSDQLVHYLIGDHPVFSEKYFTIVDKDRPSSGSPRLRHFAFQYALYHLLMDIGISTPMVMGIGTGKILTALLTGSIGLSEAVEKIGCYQPEDIGNFKERAERLASRQLQNGPVTFIGMGQEGPLFRALKDYPAGKEELCVLSLSPELQAGAFAALLKELYMLNHDIDWPAVYRRGGYRKVELPGYSFERCACWIRERAREDRPQRNGIGRHNPAGLQIYRDGILLGPDDGGELLSAIGRFWAEGIGIGSLDVKDNFFGLGGDSLTASRIINRVNDHFGLKLDFEDLFDLPTLESFSQLVREQWDTMRMITTFWKDVLKMQDIGPEDNFFELGGHSLLANQIINRMRKEFDMDLDFDVFFNYPSIREMACYIDETREKGGGRQTIGKTAQQEDYPLSHAQKRLWILSQLDEGSVAYNNSNARVVKGKLDKPVLRDAFDHLLRRHEILRTVFIVKGGELRQKILELSALGFVLDGRDLRRHADREELAQRIVADEATKPFDLSNGPLLRVSLLQLEEEKFIFISTLHHIICDGWSMNIFVGELLRLYNSLRRGQGDPLSPLPIQYKDYAVWQNLQLQDPSFLQSKAYWIEQFQALPPPLELPIAGVRPAIKSYRGDSFTFEIGSLTLKGLEALVLRQQVSLFTVLLSTLNVLFHRYTGQTDIVVGTPVLGRDTLELEGQIGCYVNTLALRTKLGSHESFGQVLGATNETLRSAFRHQAYPFDCLVDDLDLPRDLSHSPLFDILVVQNPGEEPGELPDELMLSEEGLSDQHVVSKFDMTIDFLERPDQVSVNIEFNTDLFHKKDIRHLATHYIAMLGAVIEDPARPIGSIGYLSSPEREQLVNGLNDTSKPLPHHKPVHHLIAEQAAANPSAEAVVFGQWSVSYKDLNEEANLLAHYLVVVRGVRPGDLVGLCIDRSERMVIAILAVLKAGAAYVPVEPGHPPARIAQILADSSPRLTITQEKYLSCLPDDTPHILWQDNGLRLAGPTEDPVVEVTAAHPCYVLYTSGSTGRAKGVKVTHGNVSAFMHWAALEFSASPFETVLATTSYCFDISVFELLFPLCAGRRIRMLESAADIEEYLGKENRLLINTVPSVVATLLKEKVNLANVTVLNMAGEPIPYSIKENIDYHRMEVRNLYGPTECTIYSTCYRFSDRHSIIPIGTPIANTRIYITDELLNLVPPGFPGEICIAGEGVARGYWNNSVETERLYMDNPFEAAGKLYRTGDVGRWLEDGNIEYLGRKDHQLKIRGFRIEAGEIEQLLLRYPGIQHVLVTAWKGQRDQPALTAWFTSDRDIPAAELSVYISKTLPRYFLPEYYKRIDKFPLTANGKVDRKALPDPGIGRQEMLTTACLPPEGTIEKVMTVVWESVLNKQGIGVTQDFFELGGHSLKATQVISRMARIFGIRMDFKTFFLHPTIRGLSSIVERSKSNQYTGITPAPPQESYPLSVMQREFWITEQTNAGLPVYHLPGMVRLTGGLDVDALEKTFHALTARHESLRTTFVLVGGEPRQKIHDRLSSGDAWAYADISYEADPEKEAVRLAGEEIKRPFQLDKGPLLRAKLLRTSDKEHLLLITIHHIIVDGWSVRILMQEAIKLYQAFRDHRPAPLSPLRIQYKDFAAYHNALLESENGRYMLDYWREKLGGPLRPMALPVDFERRGPRFARAGSHRLTIPEEQVTSLVATGQRNHCTTYMLLLSCINILLQQLTGNEDILVCSPVAGRLHEELEGQVGLFTNTLILRNSVRPGEPFQALLKQVRQTTLDAFAHQMIPYGKLMQILPGNGMGGDLLSVGFTLQNQLERSMADELPATGLVVKSMEGENPEMIAVKDLWFIAFESGQTIEFSVLYNTTLFRRTTIESIAASLSHIITRVCANDNILIGGISAMAGNKSLEYEEIISLSQS
jgi:amino acid adenylation domain-containing protein